MTISVDPATRIITVPTADLTLLAPAAPPFGARYSYDVNVLRLELKDWEDSEEGIELPVTHSHNTQVTLSGVTYAKQFIIINGYTVTFEAGSYSVALSGANHNVGDVQNVNGVSLIIGNSAGLIVTTGGAGASAAEVWQYLFATGNTSEEELTKARKAAQAAMGLSA